MCAGGWNLCAWVLLEHVEIRTEILHHINPLIILKHFVTKSHHDHHQIVPLKLKSEERWNHSLPNELKSACRAAITVRRRSAISGFFLTRACVPGVTPASCFRRQMVRWWKSPRVMKKLWFSCQKRIDFMPIVKLFESRKLLRAPTSELYRTNLKNGPKSAESSVSCQQCGTPRSVSGPNNAIV